MTCRQAVPADLPDLNALYTQIIRSMNAQGICIWDDEYPTGLFKEDIRRGGLYVLERDGILAAAFALAPTNHAESAISWPQSGARPCYFARLGVNPAFQRQGIGRAALDAAKERARAQGAQVLRLFAAAINTPARRLYTACGFTQAQGIWLEPAGDGDLEEYGYEAAL